MKTVSCRDIGMDCDFKAVGATVDEVLEKCAAHGKKDHGMQTIPPDVTQKIKAAIRDQPAQAGAGR